MSTYGTVCTICGRNWIRKNKFFLTYSDTQLKRNICQLLGNITKHSADFATQVMNKIKINLLQKLLNCLKDPDDIIKKIEPYCVCEIVNKSPENANHV